MPKIPLRLIVAPRHQVQLQEMERRLKVNERPTIFIDEPHPMHLFLRTLVTPLTVILKSRLHLCQWHPPPLSTLPYRCLLLVSLPMTKRPSSPTTTSFRPPTQQLPARRRRVCMRVTSSADTTSTRRIRLLPPLRRPPADFTPLQSWKQIM